MEQLLPGVAVGLRSRRTRRRGGEIGPYALGEPNTRERPAWLEFIAARERWRAVLASGEASGLECEMDLLAELRDRGWRWDDLPGESPFAAALTAPRRLTGGWYDFIVAIEARHLSM